MDCVVVDLANELLTAVKELLVCEEVLSSSHLKHRIF